MAKQKTKLELTWIGTENRPKPEPCVLMEDPGEVLPMRRIAPA